jgi:uncharacterized membrane protein YidH (DUF202 family)
VDLNPFDWLQNPTGTAENTLLAWLSTPSAKIGLGVALGIAGLAIFVAKKQSSNISRVTAQMAPAIAPMGLFELAGMGG